ncbi:MAG TPA: sugar phosphate isomerase/epimerase family protein [Vicinamibacterales bacterium]|nr:sugar phosphate isomerase/epimerase family protein [Vicinamibacterales bacterium]
MKFAFLTVTYSGQFYDGPALTVVEQIRRATELGFDGISIEAKRPVASPLDLTKRDRQAIRAAAQAEGIAICAIESMSNFASAIMEERENNLAMMRQVIELACDLEVGLVKVFAAWPGVINDEDDTAFYGPYQRESYFKQLYPADLRRWDRAVAGLRETADWAAERGITLALQNHAPVLRTGYEDALAMMQQVERPNVGLCLDVPLFKERQSDAYVTEAVRACGEHIRLTHYGAWNFAEAPAGGAVQRAAPSVGGEINYRRFLAELQQAGYEGYLVAEYCLPCVRNYRIAGIDEIDRANRLALAYMRSLMPATQTV